MKKILLILVLITSLMMPSKAVLKGYNLDQTISMLNSELEVFDHRVDSISNLFTLARARFNTRFYELNRELESVAIMFYSQQETYLFGQAYSAEKASNLCKEFDKMKQQSTSWLDQYTVNYERCIKLQQTVESIDPNKLSVEGRKNRAKCLQTITTVLETLDHWKGHMVEDKVDMDELDRKVSILKADIDNCYSHLHTRVFLDRDLPYHQVFVNVPSAWGTLSKGLSCMFNPSQYGWDYKSKWAHSGWMIVLVFLITFILGVIFGRLAVNRWLRKQSLTVMANASTVTMLIAWTVGTLSLLILYFFVLDNEFYRSGTELFIELGMLCIVIAGSILYRVPAEKCRLTMQGYTPTFLLTAITLFYRIALSDVDMLRVSLVPVLIVCTLMQLRYNIRTTGIAQFDRIVTNISLSIYVISTILAWIGYYFLATQIVAFWSILLTGHLFLSCFYSYFSGREKKLLQHNKHYSSSIECVTINRLVKPMMLLLVLFACLYEAAHIFNISEWVRQVFESYFIDFPDKVRISVARIVQVLFIAILINYTIGLAKSIAKKYFGEKSKVGSVNLALNILTILAWGLFIIVVLAIFEVNGVGVIAVISGITVGVGIALRDTLDCFFCGLSLMMGRLHIGDMVECEGVRGRVLDIRYRTTQILTDEGAVISFFNTAFFGKNYRNLNALGHFQREHLFFKMQKDADIAKMFPIMEEALATRVPGICMNPAPKILFESSDRFFVTLCAEVWVPVDKYWHTRAKVKEILFLVLKENGLSNMMEDKRTMVIIDGKE